MLFRGMNKRMVIKIFDSTTKSWELKELICPFSLSPSQKISAVAVYSGGSFHVLDHSSNKILIFNSDLLGKVLSFLSVACIIQIWYFCLHST
jgi:hypothetical protein